MPHLHYMKLTDVVASLVEGLEVDHGVGVVLGHRGLDGLWNLRQKRNHQQKLFSSSLNGS